MAHHEFGIMSTDPRPGERYDEYEPQKYNCISVDDELIEPFAWKVDEIPMYWHSLDVPGPGLAYCGITLIPPESLGPVLREVDAFMPEPPDPELLRDLWELKQLLEQALKQGKYVIHFGI